MQGARMRRFFYFVNKGAISMTDQPETGNPTTETVEEQAQTEQTPEIDASPEERIRRMEAALKKANHEAAASRKKLEAFEQAEQERKQAELSELEKAQQKAAQLETELTTLRLNELRRQAAKAAGIPADLAERLRGATLEDLQADAEELAKLLPKTKTPPPVPATNPGQANTGETDEQRRARIYGRQSNPFDPATAKDHGGGVFFRTKE
jgi:hypothetical protein